MTEIPQAEGQTRVIQIPEFALVLLVGVSGSGKSTFASRHFLETEVLSSDRYRGIVSDDENSLEATTDAFDALHQIAAIRLRRRKLVVIDATNVQPDSRKPLLTLAKDHDALAAAIILDLPERVCLDRNRARPDRDFGPHVIRNQARNLRQSMRNLRREGFRYVYTLGPADVDNVRIERTQLWTDRRTDHGPFDIIGDIHGCLDELTELLDRLGYRRDSPGMPYAHTHGRRVIFLGDLVDRGPGVVEVAEIAMSMCESGAAFAVPGNHDIKLMRYLQGKDVTIKHGLEATIAQIENLTEDRRAQFSARFPAFVDALVSHYWMDDGKLVVAHAGMKETYQGRASGRVREFAIWGDTTGEIDEFGLTIRYPWAEEYRGQATVVYGHTPIPEAEWLNNTINIDTGCVFGGKLTALRYPEREIVQVDSREVYAIPARPLAVADVAPALSLQWEADELLSAQDVLGKRIVSTSLAGNVTVRAENSAAALEVMSRFAVDPRWLIYLPPTMSPSETTKEPGYLEYPREAFAYFRGKGVPSVVCQTKHMGSRAVVVVCRDSDSARRRFGSRDAIGVCYTRTGRRFFDDYALNQGFLSEISRAMEQSGLWEELNTDWLCLDGELMPWNAKAQGLLREQYAPVAAAGKLAIESARRSVNEAIQRGLPLAEIDESLACRQNSIARYAVAYGKYCWPVSGLANHRFAPFHLLATEKTTYFDRPHEWHVKTLARLADLSELCMATESRTVSLLSDEEQAAADEWWKGYTETGGEGMVVKPADFAPARARIEIQPAVKVRGREYLRIIYGPEYTEPQNLERLRSRSLHAKRGLAMREFALGVEGLGRFVRGEPLRRVHECAFAVLALESTPVDPRL